MFQSFRVSELKQGERRKYFKDKRQKWKDKSENAWGTEQRMSEFQGLASGSSSRWCGPRFRVSSFLL